MQPSRLSACAPIAFSGFVPFFPGRNVPLHWSPKPARLPRFNELLFRIIESTHLHPVQIPHVIQIRQIGRASPEPVPHLCVKNPERTLLGL